jgi:hypothetical protein
MKQREVTTRRHEQRKGGATADQVSHDLDPAPPLRQDV